MNSGRTIMDESTGFLTHLNPGAVTETAHLEGLLAKVWDDLGGVEHGMTPEKLIGRMEDVEWRPPTLTFVIAPHGGTVLGATRVDIQQWTVDLERKTATCERIGHRQLHPMSNQIDVQPIADEITTRIVAGVTDDRLRWLGDGRVRVEVSNIFPGGSGFKQTVQARRKRLREALIKMLSPKGWVHPGSNTFGRTIPS
jgi:hypothetical protein